MSLKKTVIVGLVVVVFGIALAIGFKMKVERDAKKEITEAIERASEDFTIKYDTFSSSWTGKELTISNVSISPVNNDIIVKANKIIVSGIDITQKFQPSMCVSIEDITAPVHLMYDGNRKLKRLGYGDELLVSLTNCYEMNIQEQTFAITKYEIEVEDVGILSFDAFLEDVNFTVSVNDSKGKTDDEVMKDWSMKMNNKPMHFLNWLSLTKLKNASLQFEDKGLMDRIYNSSAKRYNTSVENARDDVLLDLESSPMSKSKLAAVKELNETLISFLKQESTGFRISSNPKKPLGASDLDKLSNYNDDFVELINLTSSNDLK